MESTEATIAPADRRDDANPIGSTTATDDSARTPVETNPSSTEPDSKPAGAGRSDPAKRTSKKSASKKHRHDKSKTSKRSSNKTVADASLSDNEDDSESSDAVDSSDSESDYGDEVEAKSSVSKKHVKVPKSKPKSTKKAKSKQEPSSNKAAKKIQKKKKRAKASAIDSDSDSSSDDESADSSDEEVSETKKLASQQDGLKDEFQALRIQVAQLQHQLAQKNNASQFAPGGFGYQFSFPMAQPQPTIQTPQIPSQVTSTHARKRGAPPPRGNPRLQSNNSLSGLGEEDKDSLDESKTPKKSGVDFKRVDWVWDNKIHNYTLQDTTESTGDSQYNDFIFHVRRTFDWEGKYRSTVVDIKSKLLRECLQDVMGDVTGVSLVDETPKVDPNLLFL